LLLFTYGNILKFCGTTLKLQSVAFLGLKIIQNTYFTKYITNKVFKTLCLPSNIFNSSGAGGFPWEIRACLCIITSHLYT